MRMHLLLCLVLSAMPLLSACNNTFIGPGRDGAAQTPPQDQLTETNGQNLATKPPECNKLFTVSGRAAKPAVDCETPINYQDVYQRAQEMTQAQLNELTCPATCSPLTSVETARIWNCIRPNPARPAIAASTVERTALCPEPEGKTLPAAQPAPAAGDFTASHGTLQDLSKQPGIITDIADGTQVNCPGRRIIRVDHQDISPKICRRARFDYQPYVVRATSVAEQEWNSFTCAPGCTKTAPFSTLRRQWRCNPDEPNKNVVEIRLWYEVECKQAAGGDNHGGGGGGNNGHNNHGKNEGH